MIRLELCILLVLDYYRGRSLYLKFMHFLTRTFVEVLINISGTVKVRFADNAQLECAMKNKVKIGRQLHYVNEFIQRPRVIKCHHCQRFGHVSRFCRSQRPTCAKCGSRDHETKESNKCPAKSALDYKCCHCEGNHIAGSRVCPIIQHKEEELYNRKKYGLLEALISELQHQHMWFVTMQSVYVE